MANNISNLQFGMTIAICISIRDEMHKAIESHITKGGKHNMGKAKDS